MHDFRPNLLIGFHDFDESSEKDLINSSDVIQISQNPYDWLGHGMYFWENNYERAIEWAEEKKKRGEIHKPAVIGAILQLGHCCDLLDAKFIEVLKEYYTLMASSYDDTQKVLPKNIDSPKDIHKDKILRILDCTAIEYMHEEIKIDYQNNVTSNGINNVKIFESIRGVFTEGGPIFEGAGIFEKSHIQICIRNPDCIKGFFNPRKSTPFQNWAVKGVEIPTSNIPYSH